jgi:hypothetical protein
MKSPLGGFGGKISLMRQPPESSFRNGPLQGVWDNFVVVENELTLHLLSILNISLYNIHLLAWFYINI